MYVLINKCFKCSFIDTYEISNNMLSVFLIHELFKDCIMQLSRYMSHLSLVRVYIDKMQGNIKPA